MLSSKLHSSIGNTDRLYVDDVFSAYLYTGNGSTQTINNGIDLADKGGLVWTKKRNSATQGDHLLVDTVQGTSPALISNSTAAQANYGVLSAFNSSGYTLTSDPFVNGSGNTYVSWTFRKAPKFFDVVTYTGNGASSRAIAHSLGQEVGMVMTKATSTTGNWNTYHRSATGDLVLNTTAAQTGSKALVNSATASTFTVSGAANTNAVTYVAYLFAHDTSADGFIQCGSYTGNGSATGPIVNLGWEPQYLMIKNASGTGNWQIIDNMRGMPAGSADATLQTNLNAAELSAEYVSSTATGFQITSTSSEVNTNGNSYIYLAIRSPNKPPTTGTEVYNAIARTGTGAAATVTGVGFAPDLVIGKNRSSTGAPNFTDRLRGATYELQSSGLSGTDPEVTFANDLLAFTMDGFTLGTGVSGQKNTSATPYIEHCFKRAPGVFDIVRYTGTGVAKNEAHNLGVAPELIILKRRNAAATQWIVTTEFSASSFAYYTLNTTQGTISSNYGVGTYHFASQPTASEIPLWSTSDTNASGGTFVAYLFATKAGISKVGSYTGNGTTQTISCGFTTGARFILIKRTDSPGDWYVWDTVRGLVAGNDPHLSLNSSAAEITTDDSLDPASVGFIVNQVAATNINVTGATYIFLAVS